MKKRNTIVIVISLLVILCLCVVPLGYYVLTRQALPTPADRKLYDGVTYMRIVDYLPRPLVVHVIKIDVGISGASFLVTPPDFTDQSDEHPLKARTTSEFMNDYGVDIAINGNGFTPWYSNTALDYYPHSGEPVTPNGPATSNGNTYSTGRGPTLYIISNDTFSFNINIGNPSNAISGDLMLVEKSQVADGLDDSTRAPRTAIGVGNNERTLILVVVDGRQPLYSQGMTYAELGELMLELGADNAMALDGGGSSTLVLRDKYGEPQVLNSPIDGNIPGRERAVANHFGIFIGNK